VKTLIFAFIIFLMSSVPPVAQTVTSVTLEWDKVDAPDLEGYKIYYNTRGSGEPYNGSNLFGMVSPTGLKQAINTQSPLDIKLTNLQNPNLPQIKLGGLESGKTYWFVATAYDELNLESNYSNEVDFLASVTITSPDNIQIEINPITAPQGNN